MDSRAIRRATNCHSASAEVRHRSQPDALLNHQHHRQWTIPKFTPLKGQTGFVTPNSFSTMLGNNFARFQSVRLYKVVIVFRILLALDTATGFWPTSEGAVTHDLLKPLKLDLLNDCEDLKDCE
jgi:hypothetical protein